MRLNPAAIGILAVFLAGPLSARRTVYRYEERSGSASWVGRYEVLSSESRIQILYSSPRETHRMTLDSALNTLDWSWESAGDSARAERRGPAVEVQGILKGKARKAAHDLGALPWYQAPDYSLAALAARSKGSRLSFWVIWPGEFSFHRISARQAGPDVFDLGSSQVPAVRLILSVAGVPEWVWKNEYWYSPEGEYLGSRGRRGGPFSPLASLRLLTKEAGP